MVANGRERAAAAAVLLALVLLPAPLLPAPLLPPLGATRAVQSLLGIGWSAAWLVATIGLQVALYGSLGVVAAFATGRGATPRARWLHRIVVPIVVAGAALAIRSLKLGHLPILSNALVPLCACALGTWTALLFRQHGARVTVAATLALAGALAAAFWPGTSSEISRATETRLRALVMVAPTLPAGEARFGALLKTAFAPAPSDPAGLAPDESNRAALLALGIALGHEGIARFVGLDARGDEVGAATRLRKGTTLRGRADWPRHFCVSAALVVLANPFVSDAGGLVKEELDALSQGTGFSFADLAADRAGARFAHAATDSEAAARAMQARLRGAYAVDDFFPPAADLPENLTVEQFRRDFGGVGSARYRQKIAEIEARLDRCAALVPP